MNQPNLVKRLLDLADEIDSNGNLDYVTDRETRLDPLVSDLKRVANDLAEIKSRLSGPFWSANG